MSVLGVATAEGRTSFEPQETIEFTASWQAENAPKSVEVRLVWYTSGKGDTDVRVVDRVVFDNPPSQESRHGSFLLPTGPYSFSGKLISLIWALELVLLPSDESTRVDLVVAPGGREVVLETPKKVAGQAPPRQEERPE